MLLPSYMILNKKALKYKIFNYKMDPSKYLKLSKIILENPTERYCEIYKITNLTTDKIYVGQAVSHILNHKRYRPYGH